MPRGRSASPSKVAGPKKDRVRVRGEPVPRVAEILTPEALEFLTTLHDRFEGKRKEALHARGSFRTVIREGHRPDFPAETKSTRTAEWKVPPPPEDLRDRRVEITGPVDRKMVINALNSGASVYMADFEDSHSPVWSATVAGQGNLLDAVRGRIEFVGPEGREVPARSRAPRP